MKVCLQPTLATPGDRIEIDSADFAALPRRPVPVGGEVLDDRAGWYHEVCIQGISSTGDHHAVRDIGADVELTSWTDDSADDAGHPDFDPTEPRDLWYHAQVIRFRPLVPDAALGGAINTAQTRIIYGGQRFLDDLAKRIGPIKGTELRPWVDFIPPPDPIHGIWTPDELHDMHVARRAPIGWRDWGGHLDAAELDAETGKVLPQYAQGRMSPPRGTLTQFLRDTTRASTVHTISGNLELAMLSAAGAGESLESGSMAASSDILAYVWHSDTTFPNVADWPNGLYECQTDCSNLDTNVTYGLLTLGASIGHFANASAGLTADQETWQQSQGAFNSSGINLASQTFDPASSFLGDRFECLIAAARSAGCHGNRSMTLDFNSDAFARGPWVAAAADQDIPPPHFDRPRGPAEMTPI